MVKLKLNDTFYIVNKNRKYKFIEVETVQIDNMNFYDSELIEGSDILLDDLIVDTAVDYSKNEPIQIYKFKNKVLEEVNDIIGFIDLSVAEQYANDLNKKLFFPIKNDNLFLYKDPKTKELICIEQVANREYIETPIQPDLFNDFITFLKGKN